MKPPGESKIPDMYMSNFSEKLKGNLATNNEMHGNLCKKIDLYQNSEQTLQRSAITDFFCTISSNSLIKETLNPIYLNVSNNSNVFIILKVNAKVKQCNSKRT